MTLRNEFEFRGSWLFRHRSFLALAGLPLLVTGLLSFTYFRNQHLWDEVWNVACLLISFSGLLVRALTVGHVPERTSGRNTSRQVASRLNTTGMYSIVRHPLYLGNYVMVLGVALFFHTWWIVALVTCICALFYERIMFAEEAFLQERFGEHFERWAAATPAVVPNLRLWKRPELPFRWQTVLRREYTGLFVVTTIFPVLEIAGDTIAEGRLRIDLPWVVLGLAGGAVYVLLRSLKKYTRWLDPLVSAS